MSKQENSKNIRQSGLTPKDYRESIELSPVRVAFVFGSIFILLSLSLYWFHSSMRSNSNLKVEEAVAILERAESLEKEITPITLELEELAANTVKDVEWLVDTLVADSFVEKHEQDLKERYRQESFYLPDEKLPDGWKDRIPAALENWYSQGLARRQQEVGQDLEQLQKFVERNLNRLERALEIQDELELAEVANVPWSRYEQNKNNIKNHLDRIDSAISATTVNAPRLPGEVYQEAASFVAPLARFSLQYRRLSALTSVPAALAYAEHYLQDAIRIDPKNPEALYQLGRVYEKMGLAVISSEYYVRAIKESPRFHRSGEIVDMFEANLEQSPDSPRAIYDLGWAYYETGRLEEAEQKMIEVLRMGGEDAMTHVLARERLNYIRQGEPPYHKLAYH